MSKFKHFVGEASLTDEPAVGTPQFINVVSLIIIGIHFEIPAAMMALHQCEPVFIGRNGYGESVAHFIAPQLVQRSHFGASPGIF